MADPTCGAHVVFRLAGTEFNPAEVLGTDKAVLVRTDQTGRRAMVAIEWTAVEAISDEHAVRQGVLDRHDRPVAVETTKDDMRDRRVRPEQRLDDQAIERFERDPVPMQVGGGPPSHAMEVGSELPAGKRHKLGHWQSEGFGHGAADLDRRINGDVGRGSVEVRAEAREPIDGALARRKRHDKAPCRHVCPIPRSIGG